MKRGLLVLALALGGLGVLGVSSSPAARRVKGDDAEVISALQLLEASAVPEAAALLLSLEKQGAEGPPVDLLRSRVAFHQGDYSGAVAALAQVPPGALGKEWESYRALAVATREATAGSVEARSQHFRLRYAPGPDAALVPLALEALEKVQSRVGEVLGYAPKEPVLVDVLPSGTSFTAASGLPREAVDTTGTIALCKWDRILITSPRSVARGYPWMDTLNHEYVHLVVARLSRNEVPVWLQEGLAHFLENRWRDGRPGELSAYEETLLARAVRTGKFITFEQMHPSMAYLPSAEASTLAFAEVTTAVQFLARGLGTAGLQALITACARTGDARKAVEEVTGLPFATWEEQWKAFLPELRLRELAQVSALKTEVLDAAAPPSDKDPEASAGDSILAGDRQRADFTRLGDLLRIRNRYRAALVEYGKAERSSPLHSPALANKMARAWLAQGEAASARDSLLRSIALYPQFTASRVTLGEALLRLGDTARARSEFETSLELNPFDPRVRGELLRLYAAAGEKALEDRERKALLALGFSPSERQAQPPSSP